MNGFGQDMRFAFRMLRKSPGFTAVVVIAMALGIGVNTSIFSVVNAILLRPLPLPAPERLLVLQETSKRKGEQEMNLSYPDFIDYRQRARSFQSIGAYAEIDFSLAIDRAPEHFSGAVVSPGLFPALGVQPVLGRGVRPEEETYGKNFSTILISQRIWTTRFGGDRHVIGRVLRMNGRQRTIVGVMPENFRFPEIADFWAPMGYNPADEPRTERYLTVVGRLRPEATLASARAELATLARGIERENPVTNAGIGAGAEPYQEAMTRDVRPMMIMLMAAVVFVLLIACANVANLMLARATARQREISLRLALGAGKARLVRQLLTESVMLALIGGALGVLVAEWLNDLMLASIPIDLPYWMRIVIDGKVLMFTVLASMLSGIVFGLAPALHISREGLYELLKEGGAQSSAGRGRNRMRSALVVAEVALALVLLAGSGLMIRSFMLMAEARSAVRAQGVLTARVLLPFATYPKPEQRRAFFHDALARAQTIPGVEAVAATAVLPLGNNQWTRSVTVEAHPAADEASTPAVEWNIATPGFFGIVGVPLHRGRDFDARDRADAPRVAIVNETAARKFWAGREALGQRLHWGGPRDTSAWMAVVGVVADVRQLAHSREQRSGVFVPLDQEPNQQMYLVLHTNRDPAALATPLRRVVQALDPSLALYNVFTLPEALSRSLWEQRIYAWLMAVFSAIALAIAAVGIYGVMAYNVAQRTQEIGIRMALGAARGAVLRMVIGQAMRLTTLGLGIGLAAAFGVTRLMASILFGVSASDPPTYLGVTLILAGSALLACWLPAHRATRIDPLVALRYE